MSADDVVVAYFRNTISLDLLRLICGDVINFGTCRTVYECDLRPDLVLKFETASYRFQNIMEWQIWCDVMHNKKAAPWLAPCELISPCGTVMAQKRTQPLAKDAYPKKLPKFLTDTKRVNYGLYDGRVVCHDYGTAKILSGDDIFDLRNVRWTDNK